jgi:hypothetical protein
MKRLSMSLKVLIGAAIVAATSVTAIGQDESANQTPKPTLTDVQRLVEIIGNDKSKVSAYCELGRLHEETRQAVEYNDGDAVAAVAAKTNDFEQQLGPEYDKVFDGLEQIDFSSDEGQKVAAAFYTLQQKCEEQKEE